MKNLPARSNACLTDPSRSGPTSVGSLGRYRECFQPGLSTKSTGFGGLRSMSRILLRVLEYAIAAGVALSVYPYHSIPSL